MKRDFSDRCLAMAGEYISNDSADHSAIFNGVLSTDDMGNWGYSNIQCNSLHSHLHSYHLTVI